MSENISVPAVAAPLPSKADLLLQLAERCEREEPSWLLTCEIEAAITGAELQDCRPQGGSIFLWDRTRPLGRREWRPQPYTSSLDAAVTLVPEGAVWLRKSSDAMTIVMPRATEEEWARHIDGYGKTPALALCAAALRARAAGDLT